jgi:cysteine desulfurase
MRYLDNAATTALDPEILAAMQPYFSEQFGNASSVHQYGRDARMAIERSRQSIATILGAKASEIVFTASATEANNLAIKGVIEKIRDEKNSSESLLEIIASPTEHPCVIESLKHVEKLGWVKIVWLDVDSAGKVSLEAVKQAITENTVLVSVMYVNNEIGTVAPVKEISETIRQVRKQRNHNPSPLPIYLHCDCVQAIQYFDCSVNTLGVDLMSITGHKLHGPKGSGFLYVRDGIQIVRQIDGGGQEYYKRAGTENVAAIVGMAEAIKKYGWRDDSGTLEKLERLRELQNYLIKEVSATISDCQVTGAIENRAPHITSFIFENVDPEALIIALDREGFAVSSGSACSSGVVRQSHVIESLKLQIAKKSAALRVSTNSETNLDDLKAFVLSLQKNVQLLREMNI